MEIRIPTLVIMPIIYVLELTYKLLLHHYGMRQPQLLTMARVKYLTLNRTFSSDKAVEELGYKPIVSLRVRNSNSFSVPIILFIFVETTPFNLNTHTFLTYVWSRMA